MPNARLPCNTPETGQTPSQKLEPCFSDKPLRNRFVVMRRIHVNSQSEQQAISVFMVRIGKDRNATVQSIRREYVRWIQTSATTEGGGGV